MLQERSPLSKEAKQVHKETSNSGDMDRHSCNLLQLLFQWNETIDCCCYCEVVVFLVWKDWIFQKNPFVIIDGNKPSSFSTCTFCPGNLHSLQSCLDHHLKDTFSQCFQSFLPEEECQTQLKLSYESNEKMSGFQNLEEHFLLRNLNLIERIARNSHTNFLKWKEIRDRGIRIRETIRFVSWGEKRLCRRRM